MIARFHYDDQTYHQFLQSDLEPTREREVTDHLEACPSCQSRLESIAQSDGWWNDLQHVLREDEDQLQAQRQPKLEFLKPSDREDSIGRFGRFEITSILGTGGMGIVLKGYDPALNRYSAIKVLAPHLACNGAARIRFSREAKSAAAVVHDHVVPIQTVDEEDGVPYFVMPVIDGQSLQQRVQRDGPLQPAEVTRIGMQIAQGLAAAHSQGLIHRDVKPANVMLENGVERVRLTDFGLARAADDASMTQSGVLTGTPQYMSPEQAHGDDLDHRSDLFSLGSVLYFMCTGHSPFRATNTVGVLHRVVSSEPRSPRSVNPDVPAWLDAIILKLLEKDKQERFESADEVASLLGDWLHHLQHPGSPAPEGFPGNSNVPPLRRHWLKLAGGALFAILATIIVLETQKGTISINTNEKADIPVRIRQGEKIVRELTIREGKGSTRLHAGDYVIELGADDLDYEIKGAKVTLSRRGEHVATVVASMPHGESEKDLTPPPNLATKADAIPETIPVQIDGVGNAIVEILQSDASTSRLTRRPEVAKANPRRMNVAADRPVMFRITGLKDYPEQPLYGIVTLRHKQHPNALPVALEDGVFHIRVSPEELDHAMEQDELVTMRYIWLPRGNTQSIGHQRLYDEMPDSLAEWQALPKHRRDLATVRLGKAMPWLLTELPKQADSILVPLGGEFPPSSDETDAVNDSNIKEHTREIGEVSLQAFPETGMIILKGAKKDVERAAKVLENLESQSGSPPKPTRPISPSDTNPTETKPPKTPSPSPPSRR